MRPAEENPATQSLSARQLELANRWLEHLRCPGGRMPETMRREFFELFWEEQLEREREGRPLRIPTGSDAEDEFLLGLAAMGAKLEHALEPFAA